MCTFVWRPARDAIYAAEQYYDNGEANFRFRPGAALASPKQPASERTSADTR